MVNDEMNIFEGAKFGDKFITRDNRIVIYLYKERRKGRWFILPDGTKFLVQTEYGNCHTDDVYQLDIVSKYHESIDEEKLDTIARKNTVEFIVRASSNSQETIGYFTGFKQGYRKAKEE